MSTARHGWPGISSAAASSLWARMPPVDGEVAPMAHLFIPGPTDVAPEILAAQTHRMIGHRSPACSDLFARIQPRLQRVFQTEQRVFIPASSGSGLQEAALRHTGRP